MSLCLTALFYFCFSFNYYSGFHSALLLLNNTELLLFWINKNKAYTINNIHIPVVVQALFLFTSFVHRTHNTWKNTPKVKFYVTRAQSKSDKLGVHIEQAFIRDKCVLFIRWFFHRPLWSCPVDCFLIFSISPVYCEYRSFMQITAFPFYSRLFPVFQTIYIPAFHGANFTTILTRY